MVWAFKMSVVLGLLPSAFGSSVRIDVDVTSSSSFAPYWKRSFGSGHAALGLRPDWQAALARGVRDYGLGGIRQHGIFDDDMDVVKLVDDEPVFNFTRIDELWDAHVRNGVKPLVELSFMPLALANCSSKVRPSSLVACPADDGWVRTGAQYPPRRWRDWYDMVRATAAHAVDRYGLEEVQGWHSASTASDDVRGPRGRLVRFIGVPRRWHWEVWNEMWGVPHASETALGNYTRTSRAVSDTRPRRRFERS